MLGILPEQQERSLIVPELDDRPLGTPREFRVLYALQQTGSRLMGDRFLANYLAECLSMVSGFGPAFQMALGAEGVKQGRKPEIIRSAAARAKETIDWAAESVTQNHHRTNVLAFWSFWAAHEAGSENVISAIIATDRSAAESVASLFKSGKCDMTTWPWPDETCLGIAQRLDQRAKDKTADGGWDAAARLTTLFGWLGTSLSIPAAAAAKFNEASLVRNVLLHRYGRLSPSDIVRAPHLVERSNNAIQITQARLAEYYKAVVEVHLAMDRAIHVAGWR